MCRVNKIKSLFIMLVFSILVACSNTAEDYAQQGDWFSVGYSDGVRGKSHRTNTDFKQYPSMNIEDYAQGYLKGVKEYCNPNHAYQIGLSGNYYEGVCEGTPDAQKFRMEWQRGWNDNQINN